MPRVLVLGTGLIGTSTALALQQGDGYDVLLHDLLPAHVDEAARRGAGRLWDGIEHVDLALVAVPPGRTAAALAALQSSDVASTYTHVASYQSQVQAEIEALSADVSAVVGGHPLAGRETAGPASASAELFVGRPWAICPSAASTHSAVQDVRDLAEAVGAEPVVLGPADHDRAVALLSHLPQVAASALAALLADQDDIAPELSGPGLVDTTRLAASSPQLWTEILQGNAREVAPVVRGLAELLTHLAQDLDTLSSDGRQGGSTSEAAIARVSELLVRGNAGRARVPVKRGLSDAGFAAVSVDVDDRPGQLANLLLAAAAAEVNVEDVRVDHVPGRPTGTIALVVAADRASHLVRALAAADWRVRQDAR